MNDVGWGIKGIFDRSSDTRGNEVLLFQMGQELAIGDEFNEYSSVFCGLLTLNQAYLIEVRSSELFVAVVVD